MDNNVNNANNVDIKEVLKDMKNRNYIFVNESADKTVYNFVKNNISCTIIIHNKMVFQLSYIHNNSLTVVTPWIDYTIDGIFSNLENLLIDTINKVNKN